MVALYCPFWRTIVFPSYLHSFLVCKPEDLLKMQADFFRTRVVWHFLIWHLAPRFAWRQAKQRSQTFQFVVTRGLRDLLESIAVNIKFLFTYVMGMVIFGTQTRVTKKPWLYIDVLLVKSKTLYFEYFLSDRLQCETSYNTPYPSTCPTNKNRTCSCLANEENTFLAYYSLQKAHCKQCIEYNGKSYRHSIRGVYYL